MRKLMFGLLWLSWELNWEVNHAKPPSAQEVLLEGCGEAKDSSVRRVRKQRLSLWVREMHQVQVTLHTPEV